MPPAKLSSYYGARKRRTAKALKDSNNDAKINDYQNSLTSIKPTNAEVIKEPSKLTELLRESTELVNTKPSGPSPPAEAPNVSQPDLKTSKSKIPRIKKSTRTKVKRQAKIIDDDSQNADKSLQPKEDNQSIARPDKQREIKLGDRLEDKPDEKLEDKPDENETVLNSTYTIIKETPQKLEAELIRSPKQNLSNPDDANADSKKEKKIHSSVSSLMSSAVTGKETPSAKAPNKHSELMRKHSARKNLFSDYRSDGLAQKNSQSNLQVQPATTDTKTKRPAISSDKLDGLKDRLSKVDQMFQKFQDFKSNKCKITSAIVLDDQHRPDTASQKPVPCYVKYHSLIAPNTALALPYEYSLLSDSFRCSDVIMSMLNDQKEVCTFDKLRNGIEKTTKRIFTRTHLGQIKTVFPHAYKYTIKKNSASVMNQKPGTPQYELVISPDMTACKGKENFASNLNSDDNSTKSNAFQAMTPAHLIERKNIFAFNLLNIAKKHHQNFLAKLYPPVLGPMDKLTKWHPKFPIDGLPGIEASELPEPPNKTKVETACDHLNKIKGCAGERKEKAVAKKNAEHASRNAFPETKTTVTNKLLKCISTDILQRIHTRESVKIIEDLTKDPKDQKRKAMKEQMPELVRILRNYFITARRAAVSLEDATQIIMDSYHSAVSPEDVHQHLQLIADVFPKWLTLIPIRKGLFLKIDKNKDINVLLDSIFV